MEQIICTLFHEPAQGAKERYILQIVTPFDEANYAANGVEIIAEPTENGGVFHLHLFFQSGDENEVIHETAPFYFPLNGIENWTLEVEYFDQNGTMIKEKNGHTTQAEANSRPRPWPKMAV